ncbi:MAG: type II secretion system minor pseudopilin GspI [Pseudomonadota bacterium]
MSNRAIKRHRCEAGFSLLEVLVAVAILSLLSLASLRLAGIGVDAAQHVKGRTHALIVAENALVDALLNRNLARGTSTRLVTNVGQSWTVRQQVSAMPDQRVLKLDIRVTGQSADAAASLTSYKVLDQNG